jgi:hypothetical protein
MDRYSLASFQVHSGIMASEHFNCRFLGCSMESL